MSSNNPGCKDSILQYLFNCLFFLAIWLIWKLVVWLYGGVAQWWDWLSGHF
ncbi:MAG: hypothetical protein K8T10_21915 [Candidatus Eremiobacteraeota bacterium]|nr:hypothetical protein [Candidatus Eremiobacteraeota bacterium]